MEITKALPEEYESVRHFYHSLIDALEGTEYHPMWQKDLYPSPEALRRAVEAGEMYGGRAGVCKGNGEVCHRYRGSCRDESHPSGRPLVPVVGKS